MVIAASSEPALILVKSQTSFIAVKKMFDCNRKFLDAVFPNIGDAILWYHYDTEN